MGPLRILKGLQKRFSINLSGEGGEYETLVIDSPLYKKAIRIIDKGIEERRDGGRLTVKDAILE